MDFNDVIRKRRSIRAYAPTIPERDLIDGIIDTARRSPTAGFSQGIDYLVIDDPTEMAFFWETTEDPEFPAPEEMAKDHPPILVLVFSDPHRYLRRYSADDKIQFGLDDLDRWPVRFWDVDAGMSAMQLQLAAVNEGLDTWFFGIAHGSDSVRAHFGVPENRSLVGVIALGYRATDEVAMGSGTTRRRRPLDEQLHRNGWS